MGRLLTFLCEAVPNWDGLKREAAAYLARLRIALALLCLGAMGCLLALAALGIAAFVELDRTMDTSTAALVVAGGFVVFAAILFAVASRLVRPRRPPPPAAHAHPPHSQSGQGTLDSDQLAALATLAGSKADDISRQIARQPVSSVATAAAVGLIVGLLTPGSRR